MNRYSLIFALLVASSFAVHPNQQGKGSAAEGQLPAKPAVTTNNGPKNQLKHGNVKAPLVEPVRFLQPFLEKAENVPLEKGGRVPKVWQGLQILFATVPHPVETNLGSAFDHNVGALLDGLQDSGYLFDSSWIPWSSSEPRNNFADDEKERDSRVKEDDSPGILLFRRNHPTSAHGSYSNGIIVFLLSEKPTQGIATVQAETAWQILQQEPLKSLILRKHLLPTEGKEFGIEGPVRILGPTFSGSFASMFHLVKFLRGKSSISGVVIRSGGVTGGDAAVASIRDLVQAFPNTFFNFGSAHHDYSDWDQIAEATLGEMGIRSSEIAFLSEDESSFGWYTQNLLDRSGHPAWRISFPRDISALRADYSQQGLFDINMPTQPWKRFLNLKSDPPNEGDSIHFFGGAATIATQEAILFGISDFLKSHGIRAVVISATNEEDRLFLTQFLHANNSGVRVMIIGNSRVFMRGSTAQFRGDLMVDDFPMLPRLHDWTASKDDYSAQVFADDVSEGTFFAAIDLFGEPDSSGPFKWFPEFSEPNWTGDESGLQSPPMYVAALGSNSTWPVAENAESRFRPQVQNQSVVEMPFALFEHSRTADCGRHTPAPQILVGRHWKILAAFVLFLVFLYCVAIWYANPISRDQFASFQPSDSWEFWILKLVVPAIVAGGAFSVLAWAVAIPGIASLDAVLWWRVAEASIFVAPLTVLVSGVCKALIRVGLIWNRKMFVSLLVTVCGTSVMCSLGNILAASHNGGIVSSVLNTYREMHWESGLSVVPTLLLFLFAILVWSTQGGNGAAILRAASPLPNFAETNARISEDQAKLILEVGYPLPNPTKVKWLWVAWAVPTALLLLAHLSFGPFKEITTLESSTITIFIRGAAAFLVAVILFDIFQFLWLWDHLRGLLLALDRETFKRSFVTIRNFDWRSLWSFTGVSFQSRREINSALIDSLLAVSNLPGFGRMRAEAIKLKDLRDYYNTCDLSEVSREEYSNDRETLLGILSWAGNWLAKYVENPKTVSKSKKLTTQEEALQRIVKSQSNSSGGEWNDEEQELSRLPESRQAVERFLCLMYIGFIQTIVARLHTLLISIASMFSMLALGIAVYPFVPVTPLLIVGGSLLALIAWAFFKVFSQMDKDPILARIVNGDSQRLQGSFYLKFAEAMALPLLTAGSSLLPGGAGRLLELAQTLFNHGS
jgi:hypothetical protein